MAQRSMLGQRLPYSACWRACSDLIVRGFAVRWDMGTAGGGGFQRAVLVVDRLRSQAVLPCPEEKHVEPATRWLHSLY